MGITRDWHAAVNVAVGTTLAACDPIDFTDFAGMSIHLKTGSGITQYAVWAADTPDGEYGEVFDVDGSAVSKVGLTATKIYEVSGAIHTLLFIKLITNVSGTVSVYLKG